MAIECTYVVFVSDGLFLVCPPPPQGPCRDDSKHLAMFKAVLKKSRDGSKGSKKDSGTWTIARKTGWLFSLGNIWPSLHIRIYGCFASVETFVNVFHTGAGLEE